MIQFVEYVSTIRCESCSNNDSKTPLPDSLAPKEMLQGGFGDFYFYDMLTAAAADGFDN